MFYVERGGEKKNRNYETTSSRKRQKRALHKMSYASTALPYSSTFLFKSKNTKK